MPLEVATKEDFRMYLHLLTLSLTYPPYIVLIRQELSVSDTKD
jgi:hypothetical protein